MISDALTLASQLAFFFFLVTLAITSAPARNADLPAVRRVRNAALAALIAEALVRVAILLGYLVYERVVHTYALQSGVASGVRPNLLRNSFFALPALIAPLIIYLGVRNPSHAQFSEPSASWQTS